MACLRVSVFAYVLTCVYGIMYASAVSESEFRLVIERLEILENKEKTNQGIIAGLQEQVNEQVVIIDKLQQEDMVKNSAMASLTKTLSVLNERVLSQSTTINDLKTELQSKEATIADLTTVISTTNEQVSILTDRVAILESDRTLLDADRSFERVQDILDQDKDVETNGTGQARNQVVAEQYNNSQAVIRKRRFIVDPEIPVAFHAVISVRDIDNIVHHQTIVFDKALLNLGAGYHSQHGLFVAPTPGIYFFSTTIMSYVGTVSEFEVEVVKNGVVLGRVFTHGDNGRHDQSAVTVLVQLATNDEVWVRQAGSHDTVIYGYYYSSFAGMLLMPQ